MTLYFYHGDLSAGFQCGDSVAVDTETTGLNLQRDRLCLVQLSTGDGNAHLVRIEPGQSQAPILQSILANDRILKLFHFARFDIAVLYKSFGTMIRSLYCTKIASKIARTYTDKHSLATLCKDILDVELSKQQQSSDWGSPELSQEQMVYAANDVLYLHSLKKALDQILERESRVDLFKSCCRFLPERALLDLAGWGDQDLFAH